MQRFAEQPCSTWKTIELALAPYKARLNRRNKYKTALDEIHGLFADVDGYRHGQCIIRRIPSGIPLPTSGTHQTESGKQTQPIGERK